MKNILIIITISTLGYSNSGGFSGTVFSESSEPLPGANVYIKNTNKSHDAQRIKIENLNNIPNYLQKAAQHSFEKNEKFRIQKNS